MEEQRLKRVEERQRILNEIKIEIPRDNRPYRWDAIRKIRIYL